ncbi:MAG: hypothetical protein FJ405_13750, partial [Verrucomicrobia bacterium]|nr:hypothetical protein [Verrucomicrobiota bacterium]
MSPYPLIRRLIVKSFVGVVVLFAASFAQVPSGIAASVPPAGIHRELYLGLDPTVFGLGALTQHPPFLASHPSTVRILTAFETELNLTNHYGQRLRAYLLPPVTGDYTFWLASDDLSELYLSKDEDPEQKQRIAFVDPRSQPRAWTTHLGQESVPIRLEAGARCYVEVLHVEQNLIDHLALRWRLPNGVVEEPIPASRCVHDLPPLPDALHPQVSVQEGQSLELKLHVRNFQPPSFRWQRDDVDLPGQTNAVLRLPRVSLGDHGHRYQAVLSNSIGSIVTSSVLLSVSPDMTPPALVEVSNVASNLVQLRFSAMLDGEKARQPDHYCVGGVPPQRVDVFEEGRVILLHTPVLNLGLPVQVRVEGLVKKVASPVPMPPTERSFVPFAFQPTALGSLDVGNGGSHETRGSLTRITSLGSANDAREDGGHYAWQWVTGDFDIQAQVQSLEGGDAWGRVGLMVREDLTAESQMAVVWAGSSQLGCLFQHRRLPRSFAISEGRPSPGIPPELWLRLQRTGNRFVAFASSDGRGWTTMGSVELSLPEWFYLGPCVAGLKSNTLTTASVEISSPIVGPIAPPESQPPSSEPPGPSSRKTSCVFTEIMYHPAGVSTDGAETMEFMELYNAGPFAEDLTGYRISGDATFMFPPGVTLLPGAYLVIARSPQAFRETHPECEAVGPFQRHLPNDSGRVRLRDKQGGVLLEVDYESEFP